MPFAQNDSLFLENSEDYFRDTMTTALSNYEQVADNAGYAAGRLVNQ